MKTPSEHYPAEYTKGSVEFFYRKFFVNEHVLIPRFETESLVREAIRRHKEHPYDTLMDMGTGSGIIPVSIVAESTPFQHVYALDKSTDALLVARKNALYNGADIEFIHSDLFSVFNDRDLSLGESLLLTANLPYVRKWDLANMSPDTAFEPEMALYGGDVDGFELYYDFFASLSWFFTHNKLKRLTVLSEFGFDQKDIADKFLTSLDLPHTFFPDPNGIYRFVTVELWTPISI